MANYINTVFLYGRRGESVPYKGAKAQRIAVSTNGLEWLTLSPNASFDIVFTQHHAFSISASASPWKLTEDLYRSHIAVSPEYRYWFRMPFYGHFMGANLIKQYVSFVHVLHPF